MSQHFTSLDWAVLAIYFAATMGIGFYFHRRSRSTEGFTAAGRSLPGWACGLSIFATFLSSISFLAIPGGAYATNWNWFVFSLSLPIATWVAVRWFMPYYRASGEVSAYAHLERRFGPWARVYAGVFYLLTQVARMGTVLYLMGLSLAMLVGWDIRTIIVAVGVSVTLYSFVGGIVAVIWTDAIQAIVLIAGALLALGVMALGLPEGPAQMFRIAAEHDKFSLGGFGPSLAEPTFWVVLVYGTVINLQNFGIDQNYVQRYIASSSDREARRSIWLGGLLYIPVSAVFLLIGTTLFAWYRTHPDDLAEVRVAVAAVGRGESREAARLLPEQLHRGHPGDVLLQEGVDARDPHAHLAVGVADVATEPLRDQHDQRQHREGHDGQPPVHPHQHHHDAGQGEHVAEDGDHARGEQLVEGVDVGGDARHQPAHRVAVVVAQAEALQVLVDLQPHVVHDALAGVLHQPGLRELQDEGPGQHHEEQQGDAIQPGQVARGDVLVDGHLRQVGLRQLQQRPRDDRRQRAGHVQAVGPQVPHQAAHQPRVVGLSECFFLVDGHLGLVAGPP